MTVDIIKSLVATGMIKGSLAEFIFQDGSVVVASMLPRPPQRMTCRGQLFERDESYRPEPSSAVAYQYRELEAPTIP